MDRLTKITLTLLLSIFLSSQVSFGGDGGDGGKFETCRYFGEPHLIPFPTTAGGPQGQFVCHPGSPETLLQNTYIDISVTTSPSGNFPIVAYTVKVPADGALPSCDVSDSASGPFSTTCTGSTAATVSIAGSTTYISHATQSINVIIDKQNLKGGYFDITIYQTFPLVTMSSGTCIKYDCVPESPAPGRKKRQAKYPQVIYQICDTAADNALQPSPRSLDPNSISLDKAACYYDVGSVLDQIYVRSVIIALVRGNRQPSGNNAEDTAFLGEVSATALKVFCNTVPTINNLITQSGRVCNDNVKPPQCLQVNDYVDLCPGDRRK